MALKLVFRPAAQADLDALDDYIAQDSPRQAAAFVQKIIERCDRLTESPKPDGFATTSAAACGLLRSSVGL